MQNGQPNRFPIKEILVFDEKKANSLVLDANLNQGVFSLEKQPLHVRYQLQWVEKPATPAGQEAGASAGPAYPGTMYIPLSDVFQNSLQIPYEEYASLPVEGLADLCLKAVLKKLDIELDA